jgi:hypothetical protein
LNPLYNHQVPVFSYKWLGLNLLGNFRAINNDDDIYGYTNSLLLLTSIYTKKLGLDGYIMASRGFYLDEPQAWYPNWMTGDRYPRNEGLLVVSAGINALYIFNGDRFSLKSTVILNERQKRSAGSFLAGAYIGLFGLERDTTSILPFTPTTPEEHSIDVTNASYANIGFLAGYGHNFIVKEYFFISLLGALGLDAESSEIQTVRPEFNNEDGEPGSVKLILRAAAGYSGDKYFAAVTLFNDANQLGRSLNYDFGFLRFTFGYRIKDFRFSFKQRKPDH